MIDARCTNSIVRCTHGGGAREAPSPSERYSARMTPQYARARRWRAERRRSGRDIVTSDGLSRLRVGKDPRSEISGISRLPLARTSVVQALLDGLHEDQQDEPIASTSTMPRMP